MKEKFLNELKEALENASIENKKDILEIYASRFDLGYEAGMLDDEIIDMLDSIEEIVAMYSKQDKSKKGFNIVLDLRYFSDFKIVESDTSEIEFVLDEKVYDYVNINKDGNEIVLKSLCEDLFIKRKKFNGVMKIGKNVLINSLNIKTVMGCDLQAKSLTAKQVVITNISGDLVFDSLVVEDSISINNTSGDINFKFLSVPKATMTTVSGDIDIDDLTCDAIKISVVSGEVKISESNNASYKMNSVSGDIIINGDVDVDRVSFSSISGSCYVNGVKVGKDISSVFKDTFAKMKF